MKRTFENKKLVGYKFQLNNGGPRVEFLLYKHTYAEDIEFLDTFDPSSCWTVHELGDLLFANSAMEIGEDGVYSGFDYLFYIGMEYT